MLRFVRRLSHLSLIVTLLLMMAGLCSAHTSFSGTPIAIPGTINAVDYDHGTQGDAYNIQQVSSSGLYRSDDASGPVPINSINQYGTATGTIIGGNGYVVGNHVVQGDWLVYTVNVATTGYYDIQVNAAPAQAGRQMDFQLDGTDITPGNLTLATTSSWGNFGVATYPSAYLTSGVHTLKALIADPNAIYVINTYTFTTHVVHTYYVSSSTGSDSNPGTQAQPFATIAKAESLTLNAGDSVLFKRGDSWREVLNPNCNGATGNPITFADYGSGAKPKFWGSNQIPVNDGQWVSQGGNVYTHNYSTQVNSVLVNQQFMIDIFNGGTGDGSVVRDPSNTPNCWKWSGGVLTISTNGTNPNTDGRQYDVCVRDNVICNGSQYASYYHNHLVFRNLVVDECGSNANPSLGYGVRIEGDGTSSGIDVLVDGCEVYRYGRHGFAVIDGSEVTFNNCYCAYPMPNVQTGQTAYVSFGNQGPNLSETSYYYNCVAEHQVDTWNGRGDFEYEAFTDHGNSLKSVTVSNFRAIDSGGDGAGNNCTFDAASGAIVTVTGGEIFGGQLITSGPGVIVDGMNIHGAYASIDMEGSNGIIQNCLVTGTNSAAPYNAAVWNRGDGNIFRYNTVVTASNAGNGFTAYCLCSLGATNGTNAQLYGNILIANALAINTFTSGDSFSSANVRNNIYQNGATFQINYGTTWNLAQWQTQGYDAGSIQVTSPTAALFTNAAAGDYTLTSGSPAIDFVPTSVAHPAKDILGNSRPHGSADDAGAYEYGGTISAPVITSAATASGTVGTAFSYQITASNSPTSFSATGLPAGVTVNTSSGLISGTPSASGTSTVTLGATNMAGTGNKTLTITVSNVAAPVISSAATASGTVGTAFSYQITASNSPVSYSASGLPAGLSVNTSTGLISGTPTTAATSTVTLGATNAGGTGNKTLTITITAVTESPYGGTRWSIPGKIEAENYDLGGEGVAYHDVDAGNTGGQYRSDNVDVRAVVSDAGSGYQVGWTSAGEYLKYMVNVTTAGNYDFQVREANGGSTNGTVHIEVDGIDVTGAMSLTTTGSWDTFTTVTKTSVALTAGQHTLRLYEDVGGPDLNWINIVTSAPAETPYGGTAWSIPGQIEAENYDLGGEGIAYHDVDAGNNGGAYRSDNVDVLTSGDTGGGYQVGWTSSGEYLKYTVNVTAAGTYKFQARVASGNGGGSFHFNVDGTNVTGTMSVADTGGYGNFVTVNSGNVTLTAGAHIIQLYEETGGFDVNWFKVTSVGPSYKINAGGGAVSPFTADQFFTSAGTGAGSTSNTITTSGVTNAAPAAVYQSERYGGDVYYTIPSLPVGASYHVRLHFAETYWTGTGQRKFNVTINGTQVLTNFDIVADAGAANKADVKDFDTIVNSSGQIIVYFHATVDNAKVSGIEITPN